MCYVPCVLDIYQNSFFSEGDTLYTMTLLLQLNYALFQDINAYAGHWLWLDDFMIFCANNLIFLWPLLLLVLWGRPLSWRNRPLRPGETEIAQESRSIVLWVAVACLLAYVF